MNLHVHDARSYAQCKRYRDVSTHTATDSMFLPVLLFIVKIQVPSNQFVSMTLRASNKLKHTNKGHNKQFVASFRSSP